MTSEQVAACVKLKIFNELINTVLVWLIEMLVYKLLQWLQNYLEQDMMLEVQIKYLSKQIDNCN